MVISALRYLPIKDELESQMACVNITSPALSLQMLTPRECKIAVKKISEVLASTKFNFEIIGTHVYLTIRR